MSFFTYEIDYSWQQLNLIKVMFCQRWRSTGLLGLLPFRYINMHDYSDGRGTIMEGDEPCPTQFICKTVSIFVKKRRNVWFDHPS